MYATRRLGGADYWWHTAIGRHLWTFREIPAIDIFTSPHDPTKPWINIAWLIDIIMYGGYELGGWTLLAASKTFIIAGAITIIAWTAHRSGRSALFIPVIVLILNIHRPRFILRPFLVTSLLTALTIGLIERERRRYRETRTPNTRGLWWLVPITWFWASTHGAFVMVWCFLGAYGLEVLLQHRPAKVDGANARAAWLRYFRGLVLLGFACVAITFAQPYGWTIYYRISELFGSGYLIAITGEWQPTLKYAAWDPALAANWWGLWSVIALSFILVGRRASLFRFCAVAGPGFLAFTAVRHLDVFLYCAAPIAILNLHEAYDARPRIREFFHAKPFLRLGWTAVVVGAIAWRSVGYFSGTVVMDGQVQRARTWDVAWMSFVRDPMEHLRHHPVEGRLFNEFEQGGFLYWHLAPYPVYIDTKGIDEEQMIRHANILYDEEMFDAAVSEDNIQAIAMTLSPKTAFMYTRLLHRPEWQFEVLAPTGYLATRRPGGAIPAGGHNQPIAPREDVAEFVVEPLPPLDMTQAKRAPYPIEQEKLGKFWAAVGMPKRAAQAYRDAVAASPHHVATRISYANGLLDLGLLRDALMVADSLGEVRDRRVRSSLAFMRARIAHLTGDVATAMIFAREVTDGEWSQSGFQLRVQLLILTNDLRAASDEARRWRTRHAQSWVALNAGANVEQLLGNYNEALALAHEGLELEPSQSVLWRTKGNIHQAQGETAKAADAFAKAKHFDVTPSAPAP